MIAPATFYETSYDSQTQTSHMVDLDLTTVYFNPDDPAKIGLKLTFEECDSFGTLNLCLASIVGMGNVTKPFTFLGAPLTAYLNYNSAVVTSAALQSFSLTAQFFDG
jgi:hypothetical protein